MINLFIGYDSRQPVAFQVAAHSAWNCSKTPMSIVRLDLSQLPIRRRGLTEFTYSRFLVPYLSKFDGVSIFLDSDVLVEADLVELLAYPLMEPNVPVFTVPHARKFERPSVMVFNNQHCHVLTPDYVNDSRHGLLDMKWASSVGSLPHAWNHLVGYDFPSPEAKLIHFTQGIPIWPETQDCEYAAVWHRVAKDTMSTVSFKELMGRSVHVAHMRTPMGA